MQNQGHSNDELARCNRHHVDAKNTGTTSSLKQTAPAVIAVLVLVFQTPELQAQGAGDDFFNTGPVIHGGTIDLPEPTGPFDGRPAPGCWVSYASGPGILGPTCAFRCVGVSNAPDYQEACDIYTSAPSTDPDRHGYAAFPYDDVRPGEPQDAPPDDGTPFCEIFTAPPNDVGADRAWFPNGHPRCMGVTGDPHLTTFDGARYDLQSGGEFVMARSVDDGFQVQARFEPHGQHAAVSVATAVAVAVPPYRISISLRSDTPLRINGEATVLPDGEYLILPDAETMILRQQRRYSIVLPDGTNVHADLFGRDTMSLFVLLAEARDGRIVGLGGGGDGNDTNDFVMASGTILASRPPAETLYSEYDESWRVTEATSLFDYGPGESFAGFQNPNMPYEIVSLETIPQADRARAESECRAAGLIAGPALEECIYDYALTGDPVFIESALSTQAPPDFIDVMQTMTLEAPDIAGAGETIEIAFSGPASGGRDLITVTAPNAPPGTYNDFQYAGQGSPASVRMPLDAGEYELRYVAVGETVLARRTITVETVPADIEVPETAIADSVVEIAFTGPAAGSGDLITVTAPDAPPGTYTQVHYATQGSPARLQMPSAAGEYEIRYVQANNRVIARRPVTVTRSAEDPGE